MHTQQSGTASAGWQLVRELHTPNPGIYWTDLALTSFVGWSTFALTVILPWTSWVALLTFVTSVVFLYRGLCFIHEIAHLRANSLRHFAVVWNAVVGIPLLLPSFMYTGVHQHHHGLATYGTDSDPEYLPFSGKPLMITVFVIQGLLIPLLLLFRFVVLAPASFISTYVRRWVWAHASALSMNVKYCREVSEATGRSMRQLELATMAFMTTTLVVLFRFGIFWRCFAVWYGVSALIAVVNTIRTLGAHRYGSNGSPLDREAQLSDSIDTPGAVWTELWAPVGLRYHALHHYFPGIPYHNLGKAYRRLREALPAEDSYHRSTSPGLPRSLSALYRGK